MLSSQSTRQIFPAALGLQQHPGRWSRPSWILRGPITTLCPRRAVCLSSVWGGGLFLKY